MTAARQLSLVPSGGAEFSSCGSYRYLLWREWGTGPRVLFVPLNPSTADAEKDDPSVRRMIAFARAWRCGSLELTNLFALRSTDPKALYTHRDPIGPANDLFIGSSARRCARVVCCWGNHGSLMDRGARVLAHLRSYGVELWCFRLTKAGQPEHPLYQPATRELVSMSMEVA